MTSRSRGRPAPRRRTSSSSSGRCGSAPAGCAARGRAWPGTRPCGGRRRARPRMPVALSPPPASPLRGGWRCAGRSGIWVPATRMSIDSLSVGNLRGRASDDDDPHPDAGELRRHNADVTTAEGAGHSRGLRDGRRERSIAAAERAISAVGRRGHSVPAGPLRRGSRLPLPRCHANVGERQPQRRDQDVRIVSMMASGDCPVHTAGRATRLTRSRRQPFRSSTSRDGAFGAAREGSPLIAGLGVSSVA